MMQTLLIIPAMADTRWMYSLRILHVAKKDLDFGVYRFAGLYSLQFNCISSGLQLHIY